MRESNAYLDVCEPLWETMEALTVEQVSGRADGEPWRIIDVVVHLLDSETQAYVRMRTIVADAEPRLVNYDEARWIAKLPGDVLDLETAATLLMGLRRVNAQLLAALPAEAWQKSGHHSVRGEISLAELVESYTEHVRTHHRQVLRILSKLDATPA